MNPADGRDSCLVAALSEAGQELIFTRGRSEFRQKLLQSCVGGGDSAAVSSIEWIFIDDATLNAAEGNDRLQALLPGSRRPSLPDVIGQKSCGDDAEYLFEIPADLVWFDGHFPDDPILPAVVQVDWAIHFGRRLGFDPDQFVGLAQLKFMAVMVPGMLVKLRLDTSGAALRFVYESAASLHSKGTVKFLAEHDNE